MGTGQCVWQRKQGEGKHDVSIFKSDAKYWLEFKKQNQKNLSFRPPAVNEESDLDNARLDASHWCQKTGNQAHTFQKDEDTFSEDLRVNSSL